MLFIIHFLLSSTINALLSEKRTNGSFAGPDAADGLNRANDAFNQQFVKRRWPTQDFTARASSRVTIFLTEAHGLRLKKIEARTTPQALRQTSTVRGVLRYGALRNSS